MAMTDQRSSGGQMFMKNLVSASGDTRITSTRMVMQMPGQDPMEMDMNMNAMAPWTMQQTTPADYCATKPK